MSNAPSSLPPRHALGLPAGSVRAMLAVSVLGLLWLLALQPMHGHSKALGAIQLPTVFMDLQIKISMRIVIDTTRGNTFTGDDQTSYSRTTPARTGKRAWILKAFARNLD